MRFMLMTAAALALAGVSTTASAAVVVERAPSGSVAGSWSNQAAFQNFLTQFTLGSGTSLASMTIYTDSILASVGDSTTLRIRADVGGSPAATNLYEIIAPIVAIGNTAYQGIVTASVDFAPILLTSGTYWIGLSGTNDELGWTSFQGSAGSMPSYQRQLSGNTVTVTPIISTLAYSLGNTPIRGAVPEPGTWAMMLLGFGGIGMAMRRRRAVAVPA